MMKNSRGIALLTVLVILTLLVIFATAFIQVVRTEVQSTENFKNALIVQDVSKTGIESLREEFSSLAHGKDGIPFTGDEIRPYVSLLDSWSIGKVGAVDQSGPRTVYDLRPWLFNQTRFDDLRINDNRFPVLVQNGSIWETGTGLRPGGGIDNFDDIRLELFAQRGVDEDPIGDFSQDGQPGIALVDDDFDSVIDVPASIPLSQGDEEDDDEDGLVDEDGIDPRGETLGEFLSDPRLDNLNLAWDKDEDYAGIDPNAGKINVNIAGNRNNNGRHGYHQGLHPSELDLETFCCLMLGIPRGLEMARALVAFREGPTPGDPGDDAVLRPLDGQIIGNSFPEILSQPPFLHQFTLNNVRGDLSDNDGDGLTDEEDEIYAGITEFAEGPNFETGFPGDLLDNRGANRDQNGELLIANGVSDGGIPGVIDDIFENDTEEDGIDDFLETRPREPFGDDTPPESRFNLRLIPGMEERLDPSDSNSPTPHQLLERFLTVESTSNRYRKETLQDTPSNRNTLNPNLILSQTPFRSRKPINYLYPLIGLDNDGDWGTNLADPTVFEYEEAPVIRDDLNGNHIPDGDWDSDGEITSGVKADSIDDDLDGVVDDTGDANRDGVSTYDPEGHVDEDAVSFESVTELDRMVLYRLMKDGDAWQQAEADNKAETLFPYARIPRLYSEPGDPGDGIDNNSNRTRWMSDGIDNDGDGLTDETFLDETTSVLGVPPEEARDEGVDEPGEFYILSWDQEAVDGIDNDPILADPNRVDYFDSDGSGGPSPGDWGVDALGRIFADGIDNNGNSEDFEDKDGDGAPSKGDVGVRVRGVDEIPFIIADGIDNNDNSDDFEDLDTNEDPDPGEPGVNTSGKVYADGLDNDGDGYIDDGIDENIDEFIDLRDEEGRVNVDNPEWPEVQRTAERFGARDNETGRFLFKHDEDPSDVQFVANLADALDFSISPALNDGANKVQIRDASQIHDATRIVEAWGNEAIRITEVMARPVIRLQPESLGITSAGGSGDEWLLLDDEDDRSHKRHFVKNLDDSDDSVGAPAGEWVFEDVPAGEYWVVVYAFFSDNVETGRVYHLGGVTGEAEGTNTEDLVSDINVEPASTVASATLFPTQDFRDAFFNTTRPKARITGVPVTVDDTLTIRLTRSVDNATSRNLSFDYVELYAPEAQYIELCNFGERPIDLAGWEIRSGSNFVTRIAETGNPAETTLLPGQFAVIYTVEDADALEPDGPSGIEALTASPYPDPDSIRTGEADPLVLTQEDMVDPDDLSGDDDDDDDDVPADTPTKAFSLTGSLEEIVFASDEASIVELWAPYNMAVPNIEDVTHVMADAFYYNSSSDFCSPVESFKRQDTFGFAPQHRGDPTRSLLQQEAAVVIADETYTVDSYVHGPMRYLAEDAAVTIAPPEEDEGMDPEITQAERNQADIFKPIAVMGRASVASATLDSTSRTEYGEILFEVSTRVRDEIAPDFSLAADDLPRVTFHWPGILNQFRDPEVNPNDPGLGLPVIYIRAGGVSGRPVGMVDFDPAENQDDGTGVDERLAFHGDLLYVIDPTGKTPTDLDEEYFDILDTQTDSIRITIRVRNSEDDPDADAPIGVDFGAPLFAYIEVSPGLSAGETLMAGDPGRDHFYYPDAPDSTYIGSDGSRFLYMDRRRNDERFQRSLRFREGRMGNCSPYLASANGRNIEKYSMGRGVFSGPTPREMAQIASRMEFLSDPIVDGLLNINVADQKVLFALPFFPPESTQFTDMRSRLRLNALMSQVLVMGRSQRGFDGEVGRIIEQGLDAQAFLQGVVGALDPLTGQPWDDRLSPHWAPSPVLNGFGDFAVDDDADRNLPGGGLDEPDEFKAPGSDDGPYTAVGDVVVPFHHPMVVESVRALHPSEFDLKPQGWTGIPVAERPQIDETDIQIMLGRLMNLITIQANEFTVISRARVIHVFPEDLNDPDADKNEILAEQKLEESFGR